MDDQREPRCERLTDDDDEDACHYLEGEGEGDERQHCNVVPEEGRRASRLSLFVRLVNVKRHADAVRRCSSGFRTGIQLPVQ